MSKLLVIKGHPLTSESSLSLKGLEVFLKTYKETHPNDVVEVVDVFNDNIPT